MSATAALAWAHDQVGTSEKPANSNKGPKITQWQVDSGFTWVPGAAQGVPWCQCFTNAVAVKGGAPQIKNGFTPDFLNGRFAAQGFDPVPLSQAQPGDFVYFKFPGVSSHRCDHVGVLISMTSSTVTCIEGNTSSSSAGSQNNGGGVYLKPRSRSLVAGAVSVPYKGSSSKPFRSINVGDVGPDVRALQVATAKRAVGCGRSDRVPVIDGVAGAETLADSAWAAWVLGVGDSQSEIRSGGISPYVQTLVRDPDERNQTQKDRAGHRREEAGCNA